MREEERKRGREEGDEEWVGGWGGMGWGGVWWGGVAPDPADPKMEACASQPRRGKEKTRTSEHPLVRCTLCTARNRARGCLVGGWPKVCG